MGPKIPIKLHPITVISTDFKESFSSSGINQVRHSISVMVDIKMAYSGYMFNSSEKISISVPVTNTVIIGEVPQYYGANSMEMVR